MPESSPHPTDGTVETGMAASPRPAPPTGRGQRRIVVAVVLCLVALVALAFWVFMVPYQSSASAGNGDTLSCSSMVNWVHGPEGERRRVEFDESCDEARSSRRTTALVIGGVVATVAFAVSTWPSRRLTGEELGPIR